MPGSIAELVDSIEARPLVMMILAPPDTSCLPLRSLGEPKVKSRGVGQRQGLSPSSLCCINTNPSFLSQTRPIKAYREMEAIPPTFGICPPIRDQIRDQVQTG